MNGGAIPDHQQLPLEVAQQVPQEAYRIFAVQGPLLDQQQQLAVGGDATDGREVIVGQGHCRSGVWPRGA